MPKKTKKSGEQARPASLTKEQKKERLRAQMRAASARYRKKLKEKQKVRAKNVVDDVKIDDVEALKKEEKRKALVRAGGVRYRKNLKEAAASGNPTARQKLDTQKEQKRLKSKLRRDKLIEEAKTNPAAREKLDRQRRKKKEAASRYREKKKKARTQVNPAPEAQPSASDIDQALVAVAAAAEKQWEEIAQNDLSTHRSHYLGYIKRHPEMNSSLNDTNPIDDNLQQPAQEMTGKLQENCSGLFAEDRPIFNDEEWAGLEQVLINEFGFAHEYLQNPEQGNQPMPGTSTQLSVEENLALANDFIARELKNQPTFTLSATDLTALYKEMPTSDTATNMTWGDFTHPTIARKRPHSQTETAGHSSTPDTQKKMQRRN